MTSKICFFCKNSGENEKTYTGHTKHTCQKLASIECLNCGAKGHTERYCDDSGKKYTTHKKPEPDTGDWQEVTKKTPLVFHVTNNGVVAEERPATPPPPPEAPKVDDDMLFPSLTADPKPLVANTLNFGALKFEKPIPVETAPVVVEHQKAREYSAAVAEFPTLPTTRPSPPARLPPPLPTIPEVPETATSQLAGVISTLSTSLQLVNSRYQAKCQEYDALLMAYNALVSVMAPTAAAPSQWGERGSSWAEEC